MDFLSSITKDVQIHIISFLDGRNLLVIPLLSKMWNTLLQRFGNSLWEEICRKELDLCFKFDEQTWKDLFKMPRSNILNVCRHLNKVSVPYLEKKTEQANWMCQETDCRYKHVSSAWACTNKDCAYIGCGRSDGSHALRHYELTKHPISKRLTTRPVFHPQTFEVTDWYGLPWCYQCNEFVGSTNKPLLEKLQVTKLISATQKNL